jgi:hypothetical protein
MLRLVLVVAAQAQVVRLVQAVLQVKLRVLAIMPPLLVLVAVELMRRSLLVAMVRLAKFG